ncbi:MAG: MarR family transcriptional regulator [Oscillospiraceae bacterium]|jgi:DNA-binding MarR family transcriptional regulator
MPNDEHTEYATKKLLDALIKFRRLRDLPYRGKHIASPCRHSDMMILFALSQLESSYPQGISISELSRHLNLKSPTVTPVVYHLEKMNLVERSTDNNDRRVIHIRLTEEGRRFLQHHKEMFMTHIRDLVNYLGTEKSIALAELLHDVYSYECKKIEQDNKQSKP